ncbi:hypothetical protein HK105_207422 [Polyrhizophydium stewartii]|uniref:Spindle and kinetochore-associated protein 1 n=1 Tax=Polyrhizophydium stewartii TaxID=2732419 RepID=A0ABR4N0M6_9FUNG|nr:Spindle and kinetochore-associated protein 1 [Polyrhizophydium stewartii]
MLAAPQAAAAAPLPSAGAGPSPPLPSPEPRASLEDLVGSLFTDRIQRLRELLAVRSATHLGTPPRQASDLKVQVAQLESQSAQLENYLKGELATLQRARAASLARLKLQEAALQRMLSMMPPSMFPPEPADASAFAPAPAAAVGAAPGAADADDGSVGSPSDASASVSGQPPAAAASASTAPVKSGKPARSIALISEAEYNKIPAYIVNRTPCERLNQAISELNHLIADKYAIIKMPQNKMNKVQRSIYWDHKQLITPDIKGLVFVTEADLKDKAGWTTSEFKFDAIGRNVIAILRHLGRIREVRGGGATRIVLQ